uniref:Uncharacterized protein n=2 Tax=Picea TaxID=3328 RepID=A0A101M1A4_PICGL|nr:hypothetical protein ABT39_MTgene3714 [Picea glauca]QHR90294.1 hypothetical protein Q903MT_gene4317 [Picea sitchensis]
MLLAIDLLLKLGLDLGLERTMPFEREGMGYRTTVSGFPTSPAPSLCEHNPNTVKGRPL